MRVFFCAHMWKNTGILIEDDGIYDIIYRLGCLCNIYV